MAHSFHYLSMAIHTMIQKKLLTGLSDTKLTLGQPKVLDYLKDHDGSQQKEIASSCHIEPASLTAVLNGMEQKGLIERRMLNGNRRSQYIFLTSKGCDMQKRVDDEFSKLEDTAFSGISEEEKQSFLEVLLKIHDNLN